MLFAVMSALVRQLGHDTPVGQMVFFRSAFAIVPVLLIYALRGELASAVYTGRPLGQLGRGLLSTGGMFTNFAALTRLPLADATAISFASPLITVALAAIVLKERVRFYRWSAVVVGFAGVMVMLIPNFEIGHYAGIGAATAAAGSIYAIASTFCNAGTVIQTRRLTQSETTPSIVFYFSLMCAIAGAVTLPFSWHQPTASEWVALMATRRSRRHRSYFPDRKLPPRHRVGGGPIRLYVDAVGADPGLCGVRRIAERAGLCRRRHRRRRRAVRDLARTPTWACSRPPEAEGPRRPEI